VRLWENHIPTIATQRRTNMSQESKIRVLTNITDKSSLKDKWYNLTYDIKYWFRGWIPYCIRNAWDEVRYFCFPRQCWLLKKIPNRWVDKDTLWEICILEGIKHYVEQDGGLGFDDDWRKSYEQSQIDPTYPDWQKKFDREVFENYELITKRLVQLEKQLDDVWNKIPPFKLPEGNVWPTLSNEEYDTRYGEIDRLETEIGMLKTHIMIWAIKNREKIWT